MAKYDLVILDEFGYISCDKEGAELLFTNLSIKTGTKSTIITTNLSFDRWGEIFINPVMTAAMTDRLIHKSFVINMNGNSYRLKETKDWLKTLCINYCSTWKNFKLNFGILTRHKIHMQSGLSQVQSDLSSLDHANST